jgi:uncharacterized membrane protein YedE/YeeE
MKSILISFVCGLVFALGLGIGGMTQPVKVIGFLDFAGSWDPSLAFVMLGAVGVYAFFYGMFVKGPHARFRSEVSLPNRGQIDLRLVGGAVIFGLGWGLAGYCPGPALTSLASGNLSPLILAGAMIAGIFLFDFVRLLTASRMVAGRYRREVTQDM